MARVPQVGKAVQATRNIAYSAVWLALVAVALFQDRDRTDFFLKLICSLCTPVDFLSAREVLPFGLWIFFCQTFSVYFQGIITSSLHALPTNRVRSIHHCEHFKLVYGREKRGKMGSHVAFILQANGLLHSVRGGVLCQDESYLNLLRDELLSNISTYDVSIEEPQYTFNELRPISSLAVDLSKPQGMKSASGFLTERCCSRLAQRLRAHSVLRNRVRYRSELFRKNVRHYMAKRLSPAHDGKE